MDPAFVPDTPLLTAAKAHPQHFDILVLLWIEDRNAFRTTLYDGRIIKEAVALGADRMCVQKSLPKTEGSLDRVARISTTEWNSSEYEACRHSDNGSTASIAAIASTCMPRDWAPETLEETESMVAVNEIMTRFALGGCGKPAMSWDSATRTNVIADATKFANAKGRWSAFLERLMSAAGTRTVKGTVQAAADIADMTRAFNEQILVPACNMASKNGNHDTTYPRCLKR
jgi:hypothetical protein